MEFNLKKTPVGILTSVLDTVAEQAVDIDFTLPDYCPDIEKILRCKLIPKIYNRNLSGGQLQIDGTTVVSILYIDSKQCLRACEQTVPFNSSLSLKSTPENAVIETSVKSEYVNCRALSQRRLTVHGAFSLYAKVISKTTLDLYSPDDSDNLEYNVKKLSCSALTSLCQEQFNAGDELQITNKPAVEYILDSDIRANITDQKVIPDKLMLSGELNVKLLYMSNEVETPQQIDYLIPFSRVIDCEGLSDNSSVYPKISVMSYDIRLKNDILSDNPVVDVDSRICVTVEGYSNAESKIVLDAFSTQYITEPEKTRVTVPVSNSVIVESVMQKESVDLDNTVSEIIDFRADYIPQNTVLNIDSVTVNSKLNICILALNDDKQPVYIERSVEFSNEIKLDGDYNDISSCSASVLSLSYRMGEENTIELRCELRFTLSLSKTETFNIVSTVIIDEDRAVPPKSSSLILYFADSGESLWDIAKNYNTRLSGIYDANNLSGEVLDSSMMLMIPTV